MSKLQSFNLYNIDPIPNPTAITISTTDLFKNDISTCGTAPHVPTRDLQPW